MRIDLGDGKRALVKRKMTFLRLFFFLLSSSSYGKQIRWGVKDHQVTLPFSRGMRSFGNEKKNKKQVTSKDPYL